MFSAARSFFKKTYGLALGLEKVSSSEEIASILIRKGKP
jgi:hypothetical protein